MPALYNEIEPFACDWLENLERAGHIAHGRVDRRSIRDLLAADVAGAGQRHFFAGIGVWSHALRLSGWPDDLDVWTGSCPCQPLSSAGRRRGFDDERHLWPEWSRLIRECRPTVVFGEQVASKDALPWLDLVRADLEGAGYAFGAADLCAAGVGAPHIRQRFFFVAIADGERFKGIRLQLRERRSQQAVPEVGGRGEAGRLADAEHNNGTGRLPESHGRSTIEPDRHGATCGFWADAEWIACRDGVYRPIEPGTFPLAHGAPSRMGRLCAYGNAIVPEVAAEFIGSVVDFLVCNQDVSTMRP